LILGARTKRKKRSLEGALIFAPCPLFSSKIPGHKEFSASQSVISLAIEYQGIGSCLIFETYAASIPPEHF